MSDDLDELSRLGQALQPECYRSDVERVEQALLGLRMVESSGDVDWTFVSERVLAAICAAAQQERDETFYAECGKWPRRAYSMPRAVLHAALAALTDHPGGTDNG